MRVTLCVDALDPKPGGIGRYTWQLCRGLAGHPAISELHHYAREQIIHDPATLLVGEPKPLSGRRVGRWLARRRDRRVLAGTLVHGPNYFLPPGAETGIITVHDLSVFRYPETHPTARLQAFEREFLSSLGRAGHVLTDTETVRQELIESFSIAPENVTAVWLGVDAGFRPMAAEELGPPLAHFGLVPGGYGLCVSALEPRKRIGELLTAWRGLPRPVRDRYPLVLAGGGGWRNEDLHSQIRLAAAEGWLRHLGFVDEQALPALYAGARLFCYPSIYEGFGLPPLEAMASGVPVVVSNRSCLPEVCGDAAQYVDPDDVEGFIQTLSTSLADEHLRFAAIKSGLTRVHLFGWDRCIEGTVLAYKAANSRP